MNKTLLSALLTLLLLLTACGTDKNSPVYLRKQQFKEMLRTRESLQGMLNGRLSYDPDTFLKTAQALENQSAQPWQWFHEMQVADDSKAKQDIWQEAQAFRAAQDELTKSLQALTVAAQTKPKDKSQLTPTLKGVEQACASCHSRFKVE
ncbi:cytochrome c [Chitinivorax sp. B]|uniref:c-type cytochrome n=1 Tax=Chitinivorax sp. B TaxID=2502235 RepID=UPI0010F779D5|nr:cytochrome c [Chitinivorax sp. B]